MIHKTVPRAIAPRVRAEEAACMGTRLRERLKEIASLYESRRDLRAELPLEDIFRQIFDHLIAAMHFPAIASAMIELDGRQFTSENYQEGSTHALQSNIAVRDRLCGHIRVFYPGNTSFLLPEEQELIDEIAYDLETWLREINRLYGIRRSAELDLPLEDVCQQVFRHLIPALQFPKAATVLIELGDRRFVGEDHGDDSTHELRSKISADDKSGEQRRAQELYANIAMNNELSGHLRVFYPEDKLFLLPDEQELIDAIAQNLERWLKEVNCLHEIRRAAGLELSMEDVCRKIFKHLVPALQFPTEATVVIELDDKRFATGSNEQEGLTHELHSKITVDRKLRGKLRVFYSFDNPFLIPEEQRLIDAVGIELGKWLEAKKIDETLLERLREITCLYEIRRNLGQELSFDNVCQHIFAHLIPAMQFPEIAAAVIEVDGRRFISRNQAPGLTHELVSGITVNKRLRGHLWVFYPEDKAFLLRQEQRLIDAVTCDLERWLEGKQLEQDISGLGSPEDAKVAAPTAKQAQDAVARGKELAQGLLPFELETYGLMTALEALAKRVADVYKISCEFIHKDDVAINDNKVALNLYRIVQEAISNAIRHGSAHHIAISLGSDRGTLYLSICDDGTEISGIDTDQGSAVRVGIKIMHYRARELSAELKFLPSPTGGTEVRLEMPMGRES
jgi:two-component system, NarL family, sensor kinase